MNTPIGFIVSWKVPATVLLADLRSGIRAAGLDAVELAPDLQPRSLVSRSAAFIAKGLSTKDERRLSRPVAPKVRQITHEQLGSFGGLAYSREAGIEYNDVTQRLKCDEPSIARTLDDTAKTIDETRTASDVTRVMQRIVELAGADLIPVREQGGAYFIPTGSNVITQMDMVLSAIGGTLSRFACTIGHGSDESVATVITDYMLKQIGELKVAVEELNEAGIRADVKSRRLTRVAELRERIYAYTTLVGTQASTLTQALDHAEMVLLAKLGMNDQPDEIVAAMTESA
ncbi:MAG: hypothetical protein ACRDQZ_13235 [Mycobacteriales bacterium]